MLTTQQTKNLLSYYLLVVSIIITDNNYPGIDYLTEKYNCFFDDIPHTDIDKDNQQIQSYIERWNMGDSFYESEQYHILHFTMDIVGISFKTNNIITDLISKHTQYFSNYSGLVNTNQIYTLHELIKRKQRDIIKKNLLLMRSIALDEFKEKIKQL